MPAWLRAYGELNEFLAPAARFATRGHEVARGQTVKDFIEGRGIPHTEVDLVLVNGESVPFGHHLDDGDRVAVYPVFEAFDIAPVTRVRPEPLRDTRFVLDVHLGRLARHLRIAGFDALYDREADDRRLAELSLAERRVLLTRDRALLKRSAVTHGYYVRSSVPARQLAEVIRRFDLRRVVRPFSRCALCNGLLETAELRDVEAEVPEGSRRHGASFVRCASCRRVYWRGSHVGRLEALLAAALDAIPGADA